VRLPPPNRVSTTDEADREHPPTSPPQGDASLDDAAIQRAEARPTVVLAVSGSIAAYKAVEVARLLIKGKARVVPVMTPSAQEFVGPLTLAGITGENVHTDLFDPDFPGEVHVALAQHADLVLLVPATADLLARMAQGRADDLVSALALCARGPVIVAPAMHPRMWSHPATQRNVAALRADGRVEIIGPVDGEVASGESGVGRMAAPEVIAAAALTRCAKRDLAPLRILISAGPTIEDFDPVRFIGNRSTGKMGFAIAERAATRGATVTLIAGPVQLPTPHGVHRVDVRSAIAMRSALWQALGPELKGADALVMSAAVSDYRPSEAHASKVRRTAQPIALELVPNPDILAEIGAARADRTPVLVGFAVETDTDDRVIASALNKLETKRVDMVVANHAHDAFGKDDNRATIVARAGSESLGLMSKTDLADRILDRIAALYRR
jgi:phosphopantothenoylcysteine decarboxylase / phosphopantothenate---cysteine ligase